MSQMIARFMMSVRLGSETTPETKLIPVNSKKKTAAFVGLPPQTPTPAVPLFPVDCHFTPMLSGVDAPPLSLHTYVKVAPAIMHCPPVVPQRFRTSSPYP